MDLSQYNQSLKNPLLIDKEEVIKVLNDLTANFPSDEIPFEVIEQALSRFTQVTDLGRLQNHPSIDSLDKILARHKPPHLS